MEYKLENEMLKATINADGAELTSLKDTETDLEYIWQADSSIWARHAPILFPIVGKLKDNTYTYSGKNYVLSQHGFARDLVFSCFYKDKQKIILMLDASDATREIFPFDFVLLVSYTLNEKTLSITYQVENKDKVMMPFSIGAHPAFNCPLSAGESREDYYLEFEKEETLETYLLEAGLFSGETELLYESTTVLPLKQEIFAKDALVFKNLRSDFVTLKSRKKPFAIKVTIKGFPFLGIWSKSEASRFVCIEPWYGLSDQKDASGNLFEKEGIQHLAPQGIFTCHHSVTIGR